MAENASNTGQSIIVDLDGTLCDIEHRVHHVQQSSKNWSAFHNGLVDDKINPWCEKLIRAMADHEYQIILLTGRGEEFRDQTLDWLKRHHIAFEHLFMRPKADRRSDYVIKREIYETRIRDYYDVLFVVEDRASVVKMWREIGLVALQCDWGNF